MSTRATPDTAVSPTLDTITVSTMPTSMTKTCSIARGHRRFFKSLLENSIRSRLDLEMVYSLQHTQYSSRSNQLCTVDRAASNGVSIPGR